MAAIQHPYLPQSLELPGFVPPSITQGYILSVFGFATVAVVFSTWILTGRYKHIRSKVERAIVCWWMLTGLIHVFVEGYFVFTPDFYKRTNYFAEIWKEYSKGDSRYVGRDPAVVIVEGITAVLEGPLCFYVVYALLYRKACRHTLQIAVALGQIYGCLVYFGTPILEGKTYSLPTFVYFWLYYVVLNNIWVVVPGLIAGRAWILINKAVDERTPSSRNKKPLKQK